MRSSEKPMRKVKLSNGAATNSLLLVIVNVVTTLLGIIVTKLLSVHFSLVEYGTYSQALLVTSTATSISILGLTNATNYFYNRTNDELLQKKYISTIFTIQYIVGVVCAILIVISRGIVSRYFDNERLYKVLIVIALTPMMSNLIQMYQTLFVSIGEAKKIAARNLIVSVGKLVGGLVACFVVDNIVLVLGIVLVMDIIQVMYFSMLFGKDRFLVSVKSADLFLVKEILSFSIPMAVYVLTNTLSRDIDKYVVSAFSNTETLAIYSNASKILPFDLLTTSLITILIPIITRFINQKNYDEAKNVFSVYLRMGYLVTCILVGGAIAVAKYVMLFLYDDKYIAGLSVFMIYLFIDMIRFANVTTILSGAGKSKILMYISIATLLANAIFNVLGYKLLGMIGPAIVTLLLTIMMTLALLHFGAKEIKTKVIKLFNLREMCIVFAEIVAVGVGCKYLATCLETMKVPLFFILAISYGLYLIILLGLNYKRIIGCYRQLNHYK